MQMSKSKKDKKEKKKQKQLQKLQQNTQKFDILDLIRTEQIDTKPNFAKFLDQYVERISVVVDNGKIQFYPTVRYSFPKILVRFLDKHELIYDKNGLGGHEHYYMFDDLTEIQLNQKDEETVKSFFDFLLGFNFLSF